MKLYLEGTRKEILSQISEIICAFDGKDAPAGAAKNGKSKKDKEETFDLPENEEEENELPAEEENEEEEEVSTGPSVDDVMNKFRAFVLKGEKQKAIAKKVLATYKVKSVRELDAADYQDALDALKVK